MLYSIIPGITSYHAYHHIILSIYVYSYSIHSTLHYVALFHYYSYIINVYLMMMMTMMIVPRPSLHLDQGLRLFQLAYLSVFPHWTVCFHTRPLRSDHGRSTPTPTSPCTSFTSKSAVPGLWRQQKLWG